MNEFIMAALPYVLIGVCIAVTVVKNSENKKNKDGKKDNNYMILGMCLGAAIGLFIGSYTLGNQGLGTTAGMCVGLMIGSFIK